MRANGPITTFPLSQWQPARQSVSEQRHRLPWAERCGRVRRGWWSLHWAGGDGPDALNGAEPEAWPLT